MKLTKVHCVLHTPNDLSIFGLAKNWDTGPCESGHIDHHCKKTAKLTQLRKESLEDQSNMVMNDACCSLIWAGKNYDSALTIHQIPLRDAPVLKLLSHLRRIPTCRTPSIQVDGLGRKRIWDL
jgi:hypothetical protein